MMGLDQFLFKTYDRKRYNCAHFACDVWEHLSGHERLRAALRGFLEPSRGFVVSLGDLRKCRRIKEPIKECLVLFQSKHESHVGVYSRGKVFHLQESGPIWQDIGTLRPFWKKVIFFTC